MASKNLRDLDLLLARGQKKTLDIRETGEGPLSYSPETPTGSPGTGVPNPPVGRGGQSAYGSTPFGGYEAFPGLSPEEQRNLQIQVDRGVAERIRKAQSIAPSARQQTQGELINLTLLYERLGNPFSVRRLPFSVLRDMTTDPMINFALHFTKVPLVRAPWHIEGPDAQINAAVDEAFRPVNPKIQEQICGKLAYGYQPMCKRFKIGKLLSFYRDPYGDDPEKDIPVWDSSTDPIMWEKPYVLAPEHCMPRWNQRGEFSGFYYSIVPLPNPIQIGLANLYGYSVVPGFEVTSEFAMWPVGEMESNFGSIYGMPRTNRAYRYWWSYWFRWALSDRAFENSADPPRYVYFPTDVPWALDPEDPGLAAGTPNIKHLQTIALGLGDQMRSGQTLAIPGDFIMDDQGRMSTHRKWEAGYYKPEVEWQALSQSFGYLDSLKFRCVTADTMVERFGKAIPISHLVPGNAVWTWNVKRHRFDLHDVKAVMKTGVDQRTYKVVLSTGKSFRATSNHPVLMAEDMTWRTVGDLSKGDFLFGFVNPGDPSSLSESWVQVESVEPHGIEDVWDVQIDSTHNFVSTGVVLHNSMLIPEQAFIEGTQSSSSGSKGGTSRLMGIQLGEVYQESQQLLADENDREINEYMIPQFIAANFPDRADTPCRKVSEGFGNYDTELMKQVIQLVGQVKGNLLPVDMRQLLGKLGIPLLTEVQQKQQLDQIAKEAAAMQPQQLEPERVGMQGYNAGIGKTAQGMSFYYNGPQRIDLSTSGQGFLAELPDVPAYGDASVRASMMKLRKAMLDRYQEQIDSFCAMLEEQTTLHLSQQSQQSQPQQTTPAATTPVVPSTVPPAPPAVPVAGLTPISAAGVASSVVGAWQAGRSADTARVVIAGILLAIAVRAARKELKQARLRTDSLDEGAISTFAQQRASFVVQSIDQTIREEMDTFLENELQRQTDPKKVAQDARERFADTAETHAERIVTAEVLPAYNHGSLLALRDAGVGQVMARDASDGMNRLTDSKCLATEGKIFSIDEALVRSSEEHPNGTLYWVALATDHLVVERVELVPTELNGHGELAGYDADREILYIAQEASEEQEIAFSLAIGEALKLR